MKKNKIITMLSVAMLGGAVLVGCSSKDTDKSTETAKTTQTTQSSTKSKTVKTNTDTQVVGGTGYGYVAIPSDMVAYTDTINPLDSSIGVQYATEDGESVITLSGGDLTSDQVKAADTTIETIASSMTASMLQSKVIDKDGNEQAVTESVAETVKIDGFTAARKIVSKYGNKTVMTYVAIPKDTTKLIIFTAESEDKTFDEKLLDAFATTWSLENK